jgi:acid phosphatase family membrane protein YuiD
VGSGGMPSSHTALVVGLTTAIGLKESLDSSIFALCLVFSLVVMYDATGVRLHAGRQAEVLNQLILELPPQHPVSDTRPLRDSLGHTPIQVGVGALVGMVIGYVHYNMWITQWGP